MLFMTRRRSPATVCVHGTDAQRPGPAVEPIVQTSTFVFKSQQDLADAVIGKSEGDVYTRWSNPTTRAVEKKISALEGTEDTLVLSSGMAAVSATLFALAKRGDRILSCDSIYGGTLHFFQDVLPRSGIDVEFVELDAFVDTIDESRGRYRLCYFETPTNPILRIVDIRRVVDAAQSAGMISIIDNTFATPINQRPHEMGVDIIIHSATKYLGGHSDIIAGTVSGSKRHMGVIRNTARLLGGTIDPFAAFLLDRGLKTLAVRMERHNQNAQYIAEQLVRDERIRRVYYPGLTSHPGHDIARRQMNGFGGMLTIELDGDIHSAQRFVDSLELFLNAVSLGGVESLASIPVISTHNGLSPSLIESMGISESTVRLSVGIEDREDLLRDIQYGLEKISPPV